MQGREDLQRGLTQFVHARNDYANAKAYRSDVENTLKELLGSTSEADAKQLEIDANLLDQESFAKKHGVLASKMCDPATLGHIGIVANAVELAAQSSAIERYRQMLAAPSEIKRLDAEIRNAETGMISKESAFKLGKRGQNGCLFATFVICAVLFALVALFGLLVVAVGGNTYLLGQGVMGLATLLAIFIIVRISRGKDVIKRQEAARAAKIGDLGQRKAAWEGVLNDAYVIPGYYTAIAAIKPKYVETCMTLMDMLHDARTSEQAKLKERTQAATAIGLHEEYFDAADALCDYITKNRASNLSESINLYHEEQRRKTDSAKLHESLERQAQAKEQERDRVIAEAQRQTAATISGEAARTATTLAGQFAQYKTVRDHYQNRS